MFTLCFSQSAYSYRLSGRGFMAGLSIVLKSSLLDTLSFCKGRVLSSSSFRPVELPDAEEGMISQSGNDPPFRHQDTRLDLGFILWLSYPCRDDRGTVVDRHILIGGIEVGFIPAGVGDACFGVVGRGDHGYCPHELKRVDMGAYPGVEFQGEYRFGVGIVARPQCGHKEVCRGDLTGYGIMDGDCISRIVDEEFFSRLVVLTERDVERFFPVTVSQTELAVLIAIGVLLPVFMP